jgi:alpha-beta hydrolase superfamily lysophospholipase
MSQLKANVEPTANYTESHVVAPDGSSLFVRHWLPSDTKAKAHVLILHGYMEHGGRYRELAHTLAYRGIASCAVDFRGHGRSEGQRGYVEQFGDYLGDVDAALACLGEGPRFILGHSNGALVALDYVATRAPKINGLVVTNPFLGQTVPPTGLKLWVGLKAAKYLPRLSLPSGLDAAGLSHDSAIVQGYKRDPLVFGNANAGWFRETGVAIERVCRNKAIATPLFYAYSNTDPVANPAANKQLSTALASPDKTVVLREGELHEILNETDRASLHKQIGDWILARAA